MGLSDLAEGITRGVGGMAETLAAPFSDTVVRLGVTGLSRAGKTVFITSLVANLLDRGRMVQFRPATSGSILAAYLQPQPDDTIPRFEYEAHLAALTAPVPWWPESTRRVSQLRLSFKVQPGGFLGGLQGPRIVHVDIIDYPGEWLLDLGLLDKSYADWSADVLTRIADRPGGAAYEAAMRDVDALAPLHEPTAQALARAFAAHLVEARAAGFADCSPGRFLLPGDLEGSPVLSFAPLPPEAKPSRRSLWREFERRFESYKARVVKPFFRDHFARIDRQIVLVDMLGAIHAGPQAVEETRRVMGDILDTFRPGRNDLLSRLVRGKRVDRVLFAGTKADHLHHDQHPQLTAITQALLRAAHDRSAFAGAQVKAMSIAALRSTVEDVIRHQGRELAVVRGRVEGSEKQSAFHPGALPSDPGQLLSPARTGAERWLEGDYAVMNFAPAPLMLKPGEGPPHIRLDAAAQFLLGDKL